MQENQIARNFLPVSIAILTVSDSRTEKEDKSGLLLADRIEKAGHKIAVRELVKDETSIIVEKLNSWIANSKIDVVSS